MTLEKYPKLIGIGVLTALSFSGCATFQPEERSAEDLVLSDSFTLYEETKDSPDQWWEAFESDELNTLVAKSLDGNFSIQQAVSRMDQALAIAQQNHSTLFPELNYSADGTLKSTHQDEGFSAASRLNTINSESYSVGVSSSYEVDLWKRLRANRQASNLDLASSREDLFTVMHSIAGQVTLTWLDLLEVHQVITVTQAQLEANRTTLELMELRFRKGRANSLDVLQQRQVIALTESILPPLLAQQSVLLHELNLLLGNTPNTQLALSEASFPTLGMVPAYGVPMDLLANRPDVRSSGLRLQSADWRVSAARSNRLPSLRITSGFAFNGDNVDVLFDNWMATLSSSLTGPIFDAGRRKAEVQRTRAVVDERLSAYRQTVLTALTEVENSLTRIAQQEQYVELLAKQYKAATLTHSEAQNRYQKGLNDYLPVLTALSNAQNLERGVLAADHDLLVLRVQLHLALGGQWMEEAAQRAAEEN